MACYNSTVVPANVDDVWEALRSFHDLGWASGVITQLDVVGDVADGQVGAQRILNDAFHETLRSLDDANREFTYSIDDGPGPVAADAVLQLRVQHFDLAVAEVQHALQLLGVFVLLGETAAQDVVRVRHHLEGDALQVAVELTGRQEHGLAGLEHDTL